MKYYLFIQFIDYIKIYVDRFNKSTMADPLAEEKDAMTDGKKEICILTAGSVDSGKSSFIGVMITGELDNGNGLARNKVAKHPHEKELGKTSDISTRILKFGEGDETKEIQFVDLCGHEKYLKTTLHGMTGYFADYAIVMVAANKGLLPMTVEHINILYYMNIPFIILITRVDIAPPDIYKRTIHMLRKIVKKMRRQFVLVGDIDTSNPTDDKDKAIKEVVDLAKNIRDNPNIIPAIVISNKTGYYIDVTRNLIANLEPRKDIWAKDPTTENGTIFYIDSKFAPSGVGLVVSGIVKGKPIKLNDKMFIGPYNGQFVPVRVWSMHDNDRNSVQILENRNRGCLAFRVVDKKIDFGKAQIKKGMIIVSDDIGRQPKNICYQFKGSIRILKHSTTISKKYAPVIHCGTIRQTARIILEDTQILKMGDRADVSFRFVDHPEFVEVGARFFFREGRTKGQGIITEVLSVEDDPNPNPAQPRTRKRYRHRPRRNPKYRSNNRDKPGGV